MEILFENPERNPTLSLVLLDWSVRESFHMLDYLQKQDMSRDRYEVIWIEYYGRRVNGIRERIDSASLENMPAPVDVWCVMDMSRSLYYHKHLMYNLGLVLSKGDIVCFCDSDAAVRSTFVESIIKSFDADKDIVLHLDELRSFDRRFYPFNYPPTDEIEQTSENLVIGKTTGLVDKVDPLHSLNYGACMCAKREDLIAIGGADEHIDYLGHVCGPYEMTFRLVNAGRREVWHQSEFLYHAWHPGQAGGGNYIGPHDGINISSTALDVRKTGRVMPLRENPAIRQLREGKPVAEISETLDEEEMKKWVIRTGWDWRTWLRKLWLSKNPLYGPSGKKPPHIGSFTALRVYKILLRMIFKQAVMEIKRALASRSVAAESETVTVTERKEVGRKPVKAQKGIWIRLQNLRGFMARKWAHGRFIAGECWEALEKLSTDGVREVAVFGTGDVASILCVLAGEVGVRISGVYNNIEGGGVLADRGGKVIINRIVCKHRSPQGDFESGRG